MTDIFMLFLTAVSIYVGVYTLYFAASIYFASKSRRLVTKFKYVQPLYDNNLITVVYAQNDESNVISLLETLNKQKYPKQNYQIHIILDNCSNEISNKLEFIGGAKIWRLGDGEALEKDECISWLLERLVSLQNVNAFVFLNAERQIEENFLFNVNKALFNQDVIVAKTEFEDDQNTFFSKLKMAYHKYNNAINLQSRSVMGLSTIINSDACIIKQEVIEKIRCVDFKNVDSEYKYTTLLLSSGFDSLFNPNIVTKLKISEISSRKASPLFRFELTKHCLPLMFKTRPQFAEFILNNIKPNFWFLVVAYIFLLAFSSEYAFIFDFSIVAIFFAILTISFISSLFVAKMEKAEIKYLFAYPLYRTFQNLSQSKFFARMINIFKPKINYINKDVLTVDATVTDGKNNLACQLDLISEDGLARVVFRYKKKRYSSSSQLRMYDAINDIVEKLDEHGFRIKICQSCGYFTPKVDGSTNMVKGECHKCRAQNKELAPEEIIIWSACETYLPKEINNIIDLSSYRQ